MNKHLNLLYFLQLAMPVPPFICFEQTS